MAPQIVRRLTVVGFGLLAGLLLAAPAAEQPLRVSIDSPKDGQVSPSFVVAGWAVDPDASDVGIDVLHVYAYPLFNGVFGKPIFLGTPATVPRADIAAQFGPQFLNSGFSLPVSHLADGIYRIIIYARSSKTGGVDGRQAADVTVTTPIGIPAMALDSPRPDDWVTQSFAILGWAIDSAASAGTGVDAVHVWAYPVVSGGFGAPTFLGAATYGAARPDVGAIYGAAFTNSGFVLQTAQLATGLYRVVVSARSTVSGTFNQYAIINVTVSPFIPRPAMSLDSPTDGAAPGSHFWVSGWAIDLGAPSGTGVDQVHVWAFHKDWQFGYGTIEDLGLADYGGTRPDVAAAFGARFANSAFSVYANLPWGWYDIYASMRSTVTGTYILQKIATDIRGF